MTNPETPEQNEILAQRIVRLESQVHRLKQIGIGAGVLVLLLLLVQIRDHRKLTTGQVVADTITLMDPTGTARVRLAVFPDGAGLETYAPSGERRVQLIGTGEGAALNLNIPVTAGQGEAAINLLHNNVVLSSFHDGPRGASLEMHSTEANGSAVLGLQGTTASLSLSGADEKVPKIALTADRDQACTVLSGVQEPAAGSSLCLHSPGLPSLELADVVGNRAVVGIPHSSELNNEEGSAASVILKHKSGSKVQMKPE
jgi:hypothetical protein